MKTQRIITILLAILFLGHIAYDFYFLNHFILPLEDRASQDYANYNSRIVYSFLGGERLVNIENGMRSESYPKIYSNDFLRYNDSLVRFSDKYGKIGFLSSTTMKIVIKPRFKIATEFSDGLALAVSSDSFPEKYGFINREGFWRIHPKCDLTLIFGDDDSTHFTPRFHNGFCKIKTTKGYVYIDKSGIIKSKEYRQILALMPGNYRIVEKNSGDKWGLIDSTFNETFPPIYSSKEEVIKLYKQTILNKLK